MIDATASPRVPAVFVTRPEREALRWVDALRQRGLQADAFPLIAIAAAPDQAALRGYRDALATYRAVMFVSANAVQGLLADRNTPWPAGTRAWATGPGTTQALVACGVPPAQVDAPGAQSAQFDSETLWAQVGAGVRAGDRILIVRGGDASGQPAGRDWLAARLEAAAAQVDTAVAYIREVPQWDAGQRDRAQLGVRQGAWWLFSSSEGVDNLARLLPGQDWSAARALCTHPRIAQAARAAGFGTVAMARPGLEDVAAFLQSAA